MYGYSLLKFKYLPVCYVFRENVSKYNFYFRGKVLHLHEHFSNKRSRYLFRTERAVLLHVCMTELGSERHFGLSILYAY